VARRSSKLQRKALGKKGLHQKLVEYRRKTVSLPREKANGFVSLHGEFENCDQKVIWIMNTLEGLQETDYEKWIQLMRRA
jgi:hypothetical protein